MEPIHEFLAKKTENVKSLREVVIESLREAIITGQLKPGEILRERELSDTMGVSTTPIKEAFRILEHEGLIQTVPRSGTFVSQFAETNIQEVQMLRAVVEGLCARLIALNGTDEQIKELSDQIDLMESLYKKNEKERLIEENTKFHNLIRDLPGNALVTRMLMNVAGFDKAFRKRALQDKREVSEGYTEHRQIFEAIKSRNADLAEQLTKQHIMRTVNDVLSNKNDG